MIARRPVESYGPPAATPDGVVWAKYPDDLWGELSKAVQFALRALLQVWNGLTMTERTRAEIRDVINELRAKKGLKPVTNLRTITWYFTELKRLGVIERGRVDEKRNDWYTRFSRPFQAKLPDHPVPRAGNATAVPTVEAPKSTAAIDAEYARYAVEFCERKGWRLILEGSDKLNTVPIAGTEQHPLSPDFKTVLMQKRESVIALLKGTPQRE